MLNRDIKHFARLFHEVFDENGNVRLVGRSKCSELIEAAKVVTPIYGNTSTGWMRPDSIKALYSELFPNGIQEDEDAL